MAINLMHVASLSAVAEHGSFTAAAEAIGRSHSAVSLHIKALEADLQTSLVDRSVRPPALTADGVALVGHARRLRRVLDDIRGIGRSDRLAGRLAIGIVPSAMTHLAPPVLASMRSDHPELGIDLRTGLSGELAQAVRAGDLDAAVLTAPDLAPEDLVLREISVEPLVVIAPPTIAAETDAEILSTQPFIWFSRKTWAGQQIERRLLDRGLRVRAAMEVDSLEAIAALVRHGLGIAIVPDRPGLDAGLCRVAFCDPPAVRRLVMVTRAGPPRTRQEEAVFAAFKAQAGAGRAPDHTI